MNDWMSNVSLRCDIDWVMVCLVEDEEEEDGDEFRCFEILLIWVGAT